MYVKLYQDILTSTVWMQPDHVLRVWLTMLLLANSEGYVRISIPGLAKEAGVDVLKARDALATLEAPDEDSQSKENEGRRVIRLDEAEPVWFIVNYVKYRTLKNAEAKKGYMREYMRAYRARRKQPELTSKGDVSLIPPCKSQGEGDGEGEYNPPTAPPSSQPSTSSTGDGRKKKTKKEEADPESDLEFMEFFAAYPNKKKRLDSFKAWGQVKEKRPPLEKLLAKLEEFKMSREWTKDGGEFIPAAGPWLRGHRWEDDLKVDVEDPAVAAMRREWEREGHGHVS